MAEEKILVVGKHGHDFIMKIGFVPDIVKNDVAWTDKKNNLADGTKRVDYILFYSKVTNDYNGETIYHKEIFITVDDVKRLHEKITEVESYHGSGKVPDDLPF